MLTLTADTPQHQQAFTSDAAAFGCKVLQQATSVWLLVLAQG
jgi:hypothetical protein